MAHAAIHSIMAGEELQRWSTLPSTASWQVSMLVPDFRCNHECPESKGTSHHLPSWQCRPDSAQSSCDGPRVPITLQCGCGGARPLVALDLEDLLHPDLKPLSGSTDSCAVGSEASQSGSTLQPRGCSLINLTIADLEDRNEVFGLCLTPAVGSPEPQRPRLAGSSSVGHGLPCFIPH